MITIAFVIALLIFTLASGYFSSSETALFSLSSSKIRTYQSHPNPSKKLVAKLVLRPRDLLVTIMMMNVFVNILAQNVASTLFDSWNSLALKIGVPLFLTLVFGEIIPKSLAIQNNDYISNKVAPVIDRLQKWTGPIRTRITKVTATVSRLMFFFLKKEDDISIEELKHIVQNSTNDGILQQNEMQLLLGYLDMQKATAKELMRPRQEIIYYDLEDPLEDLIEKVTVKQVTRLPVCRGDLQNVMGIITARMVFLHLHEIQEDHNLVPFLRRPFYIPETTLAPNLFQQMVEKETQMALIVDEYGSVTGLITLEDLAEEVVGPIKDERDQAKCYTFAGENVLIASGKLEIDELNYLLKTDLSSTANMVTIGGWLTENLGHLPRTGDNVRTKDLLFHVLASDPNRVRRVYIRRLQPSSTKGNTP